MLLERMQISMEILAINGPLKLTQSQARSLRRLWAGRVSILSVEISRTVFSMPVKSSSKSKSLELEVAPFPGWDFLPIPFLLPILLRFLFLCACVATDLEAEL